MEDAKRIKSRDFALRIIKLYRFLIESRVYDIAKQILRCGTSIGANVAEAECAESDSDFIHKLTIALKEANETEYWLDLLWRSDLITLQQYESLNNDCIELIKILKSIINSMKQKKNNTSHLTLHTSHFTLNP